MAGKGSVNIKIGGDASEYQKELNDVVKSTEAAASKIDNALSDAAESLSKGLSESFKAANKDQTAAVKGIGDSVKKIVSQNNDLISQKGDLGNVYDKLGEGAKNAAVKVKAGLADIKAGIDMAVAAADKLSGVVAKGVNYNATIEQMRTSFEVMTGSAEKAAEVVDTLRVMGAETPFEMTDLAGTTQLLMQYGLTADDAINKMRMLGDIAQGNSEAMTSIAMGYAQMSSAGKVNLQDIKQMINGGFNPLQEISERTGESMASLYDRISKGTMTIDEITQSMVSATSEGGKFYQSMEKQSQTLNGQLSTLKDNANQLLGTLTEGLSGGLRDELFPAVNGMIGELESAFSTNGIQGLLDSASNMIPRLMDMMSGELETALSGLSKWLPKGASVLMKAVPGALRSAGKLAPEITTIFFELASTIITDLTAMLPELVPVVVEGFGNVLLSALNGIGSLAEGFFTGVEKMFHQGQEKIAGVWVDQEALAKYTFEIDTDISPAKESVESAYSDIREALNTDLLSPEQREVIIGMIGEDYDAIKAKLMSFGLDETQASNIANQVTGASNDIIAAFAALDIGVDATTVAKWGIQANGSRIMLRTQMEKAGLSPEDQQKVIGVFEKMTGNITGNLPNVIDEIYSTLTDGKAENDDKQSLKDKLDAAYESDINEVNEWLKEKMGALDEESTTYESDIAALMEEAAGYKAEIQTLHNEATMLVDSLAGQPTAVVEARMAEFAAIEARLAEINEYISQTNEAARSAEANAFEVVRSGANADEATITQAVKFKVTEFKLEEQEAEDAYNATIEELNAKLAKKEITQEQYDDQRLTAEDTKNTAVAQAKAAFEKSFAEIMQGIAESEGNAEAFNRAMELQGAKLKIDDFWAGVAENGGTFDPSAAKTLVDNLSGSLGDALDMESIMRAIELGDEFNLRGLLDEAMQKSNIELDETTKAALGGKVGEMWKSVLDQNYLEGTSFDTSSTESQLSALFGAINLEPVGEDIASGVGLGAASYDFSTDTARADAALEKSWRAHAGSHSPAKTYVPLGSDIAAGVAQGLTEYDFSTAAASVVGNIQGAIASALQSVLDISDALLSETEKTARGMVAKAESGASGSGAAGKSKGSDFGKGYVAGVKSHINDAWQAGYKLAKAAAAGLASGQQSASPSKVAKGLGGDFGDGYSIGLRESMTRAAMVAKQLTGQIANAATINQSMRVANMPNLQQEIISANEQNKTPVYLDGYKIAEIQGYNNSTTIAWNNTRASKGVGGR